jgi:uncharacterized protein YccT (UPF0319 family)
MSKSKVEKSHKNYNKKMARAVVNQFFAMIILRSTESVPQICAKDKTTEQKEF